MHSGISVCLITKNCAKTLTETLASLKDFLRPDLGDEVVVVDTGSTDNGATVETARQAGALVLLHPELNVAGMRDLVQKYLPDHFDQIKDNPQFADGFLADFSAARQIGTNAAANAIVMWIDSDDVLRGGSELRNYCLEFFKDERNGALFLPYDYAFDSDGACTTVLWRERVVRRDSYVWAGRCHESLIPKDGRPQLIVKCPLEQCRIIHKHGRAHELSDIRNFAILRNAYDAEGERKDPRTEYYLGNACRGLRKFSEAIHWYSLVLRRSGSRDDRLSCCLNIAYIHVLRGRPWKAIDWFFQATKIWPNDQRAYFGIARCYYDLKRYNDALLWTNLGRALPPVEQVTSVDPNSYDYYPAVFASLSHKELNNVQAALDEAKLVATMRPENPASQELLNETAAWANREAIKQSISTTLAHAASRETTATIIHSLSPELRKAIPEFQLELSCTKPKRSVTFLCGTTHEHWDASSRDSGVGGSEKMVILLSEHLAKLGWKVDVYGHPHPENAYKSANGVRYLPVSAFNPTLKRDVVVIWRNWGFLDFPLKARKIFLDCHDVQDAGYASPQRLARVQGILVKSKFHGEPFKASPAEKKVIVTRNAITPEDFQGEAPVRDYDKLVYCSSADRGLLYALNIFSRVKAIRPSATLDVFYGFTPLYLQRAADVDYQFFSDIGDERHMLDYMEECYSAMDKLGATFRGRVGHKELALALRSSSIFLYPTRFPEISCMASMEAQAAGCIPVCSDTGALIETVTNGAVLKPDAADGFVTSCVKIMEQGADLDTYRREMSAEALSRFDISSLAAEWSALFAKT
jgi:glycosyltransferase involved in cell wall biosynthesis